MAATLTLPRTTGARPQGNPWVVAVTVTLATFMELLDTSIANVSLPHIAGGLGRSYDEVTWILTTYLVANAVVLPMSAWLSRRFGRKNYYMACVALFTATSFLCGIAPSLNIMLIARVLQGIGGGGLAPVEQAILVDTFPAHKRASAFALYTMAIVTAPAIGPVLGGWITDNFDWRWVFLINIPIGLVSLALTSRVVHDPPEFERERRLARQSGALRVDFVGILLIGTGSAALEVLLDRGQIDDWFGSSFISAMFIAAIGCLSTAIWWELRQTDPIIELRLLRNRNFALACSLYFLFGFGLFGSTTVIPQLLQTLYGYQAIDAGLVLGPGALVITFLAPVCAQLVQRGIAQPRFLLTGAILAVGISFLHYGHFNLDTDYSHYAWMRALQGLGYGFFFVPLSVIAYSQLSKDQNNRASSITNFFRNWGGSFGVAFIATMSDRRANFHQARLSSDVTSSSLPLLDWIQRTAAYFEVRGMSHADAFSAAYALHYQQLQTHARLLAFMDCFHILGIITLLAAPLALITRSFRNPSKDTAGH